MDGIKFDDLVGMEYGEEVDDVTQITKPVIDEAVEIASLDNANSLVVPSVLVETLKTILVGVADFSCPLDISDNIIDIPLVS